MSNIDLSKFTGSSKSLLDDLYNEERGKTEALGLNDYLALPKTDAYIRREKEKLNLSHDDWIEERYDHLINKISNQ